MARRVQSAAGVEYFGVPIGSLITPDMEDDAKAKHRGKRAPAGAVTGSNQKRAGTKDGKTGGSEFPANSQDIDTKAQTSEQSGPTDWAAKGFKKSSITGPVKVLVGKAEFSAPEGSEVFQSPSHSGRSYVVTPDGLTHIYTSKGELDITPEESQALTEQVKQRFKKAESAPEEEKSAEVTWVRLKSLIDLISQAEKVGDESEVKKLMAEFTKAVNKYDSDLNARTLKSEMST